MANRRTSERKIVDAVDFHELTNLRNPQIIASKGHIIDASASGFLLIFHRDDIKADELRTTLNIDDLLGEHVALFLPQMSIDLDGTVSRTKHLGKGIFEVGVSFSEDTPDYWRECLKDLLPFPGELE